MSKRLEEINGKSIAIAEDVLKEIEKEINIDNVKKKGEKILYDAISPIKGSQILKELNARIQSNPYTIIKDLIEGKPYEALDKLGDFATQNNAMVADMGIKIDYSNLGQKVKKGDLSGIVSLDPSNISINTRWVSVKGKINYEKNNDRFGDVWKGIIDLVVRKPKPFTLKAIYINGRKDDLSYWFAQISPADGKTDIGGVIPKKAVKLDKPAKIGPATIMAALGRVYNKMRDDPDVGIVPDASKRYGAYMNLIIFDTQSAGSKLRLDLAAGYELNEDGNYKIEFIGDGQHGSSFPEIHKPDEYAMVNASLTLRYNSAERHFYAKGTAVILQEGLCASGMVEIDIKPEWWFVNVGSREEMIRVLPGCAGFGARGWVGLNPKEVYLGAGLELAIYGNFNTTFQRVTVGVLVDAGAAIGLQAAIQYRPNVQVREAGLWAEGWGNIAVYYSIRTDIKTIRGRFDLINARVDADMIFYFKPQPTKVVGTAKGQVTVLGMFRTDFSAGFSEVLN